MNDYQDQDNEDIHHVTELFLFVCVVRTLKIYSQQFPSMRYHFNSRLYTTEQIIIFIKMLGDHLEALALS